MSCRPAISSHSLGRAWVHDLPAKLDQAARYGLDIELFFEDLHYLALTFPGGDTPANHLAAAHTIRALCKARNLNIVCLQPFMHYEGLRDRAHHARRIDELHLWIDLALILQTDTIAIPSSFLPPSQASGDVDLIVADLREAADLGAPHGIRFAYESLAWGTYSDTWEAAWRLVELVDRHNFGICLDTFNLAARVYADPSSPCGTTGPDASSDLQASLARLVSTVDVSKIIFVQVVDAERLHSPLQPGHDFYDATQPTRMSWSRNCRLFYGEEALGGYLPIHTILKAILVDLRWRGWVSAELFNRSMSEPDPAVPASHARRARESWDKIVEDFNLEPEQHSKAASDMQDHDGFSTLSEANPIPRAQL